MNYAVLHREFREGWDEQASWKLLDVYDSEQTAIESLSTINHAKWGDLFMAVDMVNINPLCLNKYGILYIAIKNKSIVKAPKVKRSLEVSDWLSLWGGLTNISSSTILYDGCKNVNKKRIMMVGACICNLLLPYIPENAKQLLSANVDLEKSILNDKCMNFEIDYLWAMLNSGNYDEISHIISVIYYAVKSTYHSPVANIRQAIYYATLSGKITTYDVLVCINKYIPVSVAILAQLGEEMPL